MHHPPVTNWIKKKVLDLKTGVPEISMQCGTLRGQKYTVSFIRLNKRRYLYCNLSFCHQQHKQRITWLENPSEIIKSNQPSARSSLSFNTCRDGDFITSRGSAFQCLITLYGAENSMSKRNLPWRSVGPCPLVTNWQRRGQPPPDYNLFSGSCRQGQSLSWASFSPG